jgi:hypothetical protein
MEPVCGFNHLGVRAEAVKTLKVDSSKQSVTMRLPGKFINSIPV